MGQNLCILAADLTVLLDGNSLKDWGFKNQQGSKNWNGLLLPYFVMSNFLSALELPFGLWKTGSNKDVINLID